MKCTDEIILNKFYCFFIHVYPRQPLKMFKFHLTHLLTLLFIESPDIVLKKSICFLKDKLNVEKQSQHCGVRVLFVCSIC